MPDNQVTKSFNVKLHGSGVANCGSYPTIKAVGSITFTRNPGSDLVTWTVSGMSRSSCLPTSTTASFGYKFLAYLEVNGVRKDLIIKNNTQGPNWTNASYTTISTPHGEFHTTADTTTIKFVVKGNTCMRGGQYCYRTSGYKTIATYTIELPPYQTDYTVTYNANGGKDAPAPQSRPNTEPGSITLTTIIPIYPVSITYHNNPEYAIAVNRPFIKWNTAADGSGTDYAPGDVYSDDANLLLYAQWGEATFTPIVPNDSYYVLTYEYNGANPGYPATTLVPRVKLGYDDDSSASSVVYNVGTTYTTTADVDLYPVYGTATIAVTDMVSPTRHGHVFEGWYTDPELTHKITTDLVMTGDVTVYANWIPMPIRQFTDGDWGMANQYVWRFDGTTSTWKREAPVYQFDYFNNNWINISAGSPPPYGIFNYSKGPWAVTGLRQSFADGIEQWAQQSRFILSDSLIRKGGDANAELAFGATCCKGTYHMLCMDVAVSNSSGWHYKCASVGIRYAWHGNKGTGYFGPYGGDMDVSCKLVDWETHTNYDHTEPWDVLSRQIIKFDLSNVSQDPFYLLLHVCDAEYQIYSIWLE